MGRPRQRVASSCSESTTRLEKPHSLSYQATTLMWRPSTLRQRRVEDRRGRVAGDVRRHDRVFRVLQDAGERPLGRGPVGGEHLVARHVPRHRRVQLHDRADRHGNADRVTRELALERRQHQPDGLRGAGGRRHDVDAGRASAAGVAVRAVLQVLLLRVRVHRGHEPVLDAGEVVEHGGQRREGVRGARRVRDDRVHGRVVRIRVDPEREGDVGSVGGGAHEHLAGAGIQVHPRVLRGGEATGGLEHDVDAELGPREVRGVALREDRDAATVDDEGVAVHGHGAAEAAGRRVVGEQAGEGGGFGQVVHGDDLEVALALEQRTQHVASDASETVDGNAGHGGGSFRLPPQVRSRRPVTPAARTPWFERIAPLPDGSMRDSPHAIRG